MCESLAVMVLAFDIQHQIRNGTFVEAETYHSAACLCDETLIYCPIHLDTVWHASVLLPNLTTYLKFHITIHCGVCVGMLFAIRDLIKCSSFQNATICARICFIK